MRTPLTDHEEMEIQFIRKDLFETTKIRKVFFEMVIFSFLVFSFSCLFLFLSFLFLFLAGSLLTSYLDIVKKNIGDSVPKSVMHFLVNYVKQNLHNRLIEELYKEDKLEELLQEDKEVAAQRMNCKAMLDVLKRATTIINQVSDSEL